MQNDKFPESRILTGNQFVNAFQAGMKNNERFCFWHEVLEYAFQIYTPVVLGYGGGDHSLMDFLLEEQTQMLNGINWCYMEQYGLPDKNIQELVRKHNGCFVKMLGLTEFEQYEDDGTDTVIYAFNKEGGKVVRRICRRSAEKTAECYCQRFYAAVGT